jgi:predicted nuclease of predicted toxin-antitoxin system
MKLLLDENLSRRLVPFLQHDYPGSNQVVLLGMESATDKEVWQKAKDDGYVILTRDADFQELSLVWGQPPKVIRLKTINQTRAATLKLLIESKDVINESLLDQDLASIEIVSGFST